MPSEVSRPGPIVDVPTEEEIAVQLEILCAQEVLKGDKRSNLLRFLIRMKQCKRYVGPFKKDERPTGKRIVFEFYAEWARIAGESGPTDPDETEIAGKKLVGELASRLDEYYEAATDHVVVEILRGRNDGYQPFIAYRGDPRLSATKKAATAKTFQGDSPDDHSDNTVECGYFINDRAAMRYVLERYRSDGALQPRLVGLRDTHVRAEMPMRYREDYYTELGGAFADFLANADSDLTVCTLIFGWEVDTKYVKMVQAAATGRGDKLKCYRLQNRGPLMNFILMDYEDLTTEVLFGWGQGKPGRPGAVFRSQDTRMIEEFNNFYEGLLLASDRIPVESLLTATPRSTR